MDLSSRPDIRISKVLKRLPPDVADEIVDEVIDYIMSMECELAKSTGMTAIGRYRSSRVGHQVGGNENKPLFYNLKPWR